MPWAILAVRFTDDSDPSQVLLRDLPQLDYVDPTSTETAMDAFLSFFTPRGDRFFNAVRYFRDMSHRRIDLGGSRVFVVRLPMTKADGEPQANESGADYAARITQAAQHAAIAQGVPLGSFVAIVITSHNMLAMAQGGPIPGGAVTPGPSGWVGLDYRWVKNNGTQSFAHEMCHGLGIHHSRIDGSTVDYRDPWDIMSARNTYFAPDPTFGMRGPGLNAWNMRSRGWLEETRVWKSASATFDQTIELRPLHSLDLPGHLVAELPPNDGAGGHGRYLVEFRVPEAWDAAIPRAAVLVHRFEGTIGTFFGGHSYLMSNAARGGLWRAAQGGVDGTIGSWSAMGTTLGLGEIAVGRNSDGRLEAFALDANTGTAWHCWQDASLTGFGPWRELGSMGNLGRIVVASNADGRLEVFATDTGAGLVWHNWQSVPSGGWNGWTRLGTVQGVRSIAVGRNADGRLEAYAAATSNGFVWHAWQATPNGGWNAWQRLTDITDVGEVAVGSNKDGRLEAFAIKRSDGSVWQAWQLAVNGSFSNWARRGSLAHAKFLAVGRNADGRMQLVATDEAGAAWHAWQTAPNNGWHAWQTLAGASKLGRIAVARNASGALEVAALDDDGVCLRTRQTAAGAGFGAWSPAGDHHPGFSRLALATDAANRVNVFALDDRGHPDMVAGESATFAGTSGRRATVTVLSIDPVDRRATVRLRYG